MSHSFSLQQLGWRGFFSQQLTIEDFERSHPARVAAVHRTGAIVVSELEEQQVTLSRIERPVTVGDWLLIEGAAPRALRLLERQSLIARLAAGTGVMAQPIAANIDTLFIVTSCNEDFSLSRLERYLAIALQAQVEPVIVLTKADLCEDADSRLGEAARIAPRAQALAVNATAPECHAWFDPWLGAGQTVAFVGSSGVGKSTLVNSILGRVVRLTSAVRESDQTGKHTSTSRELIATPAGAWLIDTPGMRELKIGAVESGVRATFADIETLAQSCRFRDCTHQGDAGCAISAAIAGGSFDSRRLANYLKLQREAMHATRTVHERHEVERKFGRMHKAVKKDLSKRR